MLVAGAMIVNSQLNAAEDTHARVLGTNILQPVVRVAGHKHSSCPNVKMVQAELHGADLLHMDPDLGVVMWMVESNYPEGSGVQT